MAGHGRHGVAYYKTIKELLTHCTTLAKRPDVLFEKSPKT
jgi:hypothetical protein